MSIEYLGLSSINGPLVALEGIQDAFYDEIVEFIVDGTERKIGRIIELYEDKAVIQVFEGSENMSLKNTHTKLTGHPMEIALSPDMLGRTFNGIGQPIDDLGPIHSSLKRDVNGLPLNPVEREYPRNYIRTGISAIDGLTTLILRKWTSSRPACCTDCKTGFSGRKFRRTVCNCICRNGCKT